MKILVTGSRTWWDREPIFDALSELPDGSVIVHGASKKWDKARDAYISADYLAGLAGEALGFTVREYPADWEGPYKLRAGFIRNEEMLIKESPRIVYAFRMLGKSNGTDHMIKLAMKVGVPIELSYATGSRIRRSRVTHWSQVQKILDSE